MRVCWGTFKNTFANAGEVIFLTPARRMNLHFATSDATSIDFSHSHCLKRGL